MIRECSLITFMSWSNREVADCFLEMPKINARPLDQVEHCESIAFWLKFADSSSF